MAGSFRGRAIAALLLFALSPVAVSCGGARSGESASRSDGAPLWIWRDHDLRHVEATAFYAFRELDLADWSGPVVARVQGDEEYVLSLNGARIGSHRRGYGDEGQEFDVTRWLERGRNRLVAELRSSTGAGGFWLELRDARGPLLRTDGAWSIYRGEWRGLFRGGTIPPGDRPRVLGASPLGRWSDRVRFVPEPAFEDVVASGEPQPVRAWRPWSALPSDWRPVPERQRRPDSLGPLVEFDFGELRTGYLQLAWRELASGPAPPALVVFGVSPPGAPPQHADLLLRPIPGRNLFQDATPRRFRYVAVAGLPGLFGAEVLAVRPEAMDVLAPPPPGGPPTGVFGVAPPPPLRSPVEHEIWSELERTAGFALREVR